MKLFLNVLKRHTFMDDMDVYFISLTTSFLNTGKVFSLTRSKIRLHNYLKVVMVNVMLMT